MKKRLNYLKCTLRYYWSVIDIAATNFIFNWIHIITRRKRPEMMSEKMLKELERLVKEKKKRKNG